MHRVIEEKIEFLQKTIEETKKCNDDVELVFELIPNAHIWTDYEVNVGWDATSMKDVKAILAAFAKRKIMIDSCIDSGDSPIWYLKGINVRIRLSPSWSKEEKEGVTCRLVQTGVETFTRPTYKLVCDEKEEEAA